MYANIQIIGNLGADPELNQTKDGTQVCNISVAVNNSYRPREASESVNDTTWYRCSVWGNQANAVHQYLHKGSKVFVSGRPSLSEFTRADGSNGASIEVRAFEVKFLDPNPNGNGGNGNYQQPVQNQQGYAPPQQGYAPPQQGYAPPQQQYAPPQQQYAQPQQAGQGQRW